MIRGFTGTLSLFIAGRGSLSRLLSASSQKMMSVEAIITQKLTKEFKPVHLDVINESYMHNVPKGSETHFKVVVVSENFNDKPLIQRHRMVNEALKEELATGVHALSIQELKRVIANKTGRIMCRKDALLDQDVQMLSAGLGHFALLNQTN